MKSLIIIILLILLFLNTVHAGCRGCCSHHGGVTCVNGITQCRDNSVLSAKCKAKSCNKCGTQIKVKKSVKVDQSSELKYNRSAYRHWIDEDGDCQNTRHEILIATSQVQPKFKTVKKCIVISGKWMDRYSGQYIYKANKIDIDHVWPLKFAHDAGAKYWDKDKRKYFANDFENLIPVSARLNRQKGAKGPNKWMPPSKKYQCEYLRHWKRIGDKYNFQEPTRSPASIERQIQDTCKPDSK